MTDPREVSAFGKELPQQSVGVFVGATLPRTIGQREVSLQIERLITKIRHQARSLPQIAAQLDELIKNNNDPVHRYS